ncbi:MAG: hypothetical protein ABSC50_04410 [Candidatus Bathyarchaeia archaeon]
MKTASRLQGHFGPAMRPWLERFLIGLNMNTPNLPHHRRQGTYNSQFNSDEKSDELYRLTRSTGDYTTYSNQIHGF